jgi:hypothetical protein
MELKLATATVFIITAGINGSVTAMDERMLLVPTGSVLCVEEQATGFNWKNKAWSQADFKPSTKFLIRKLDPETYKDPETRRNAKKFFLCEDPKVTELVMEEKKLSGFVNACYEIKELGEEPNLFSYRSCIESWTKGRLDSISCSNHSSPTNFHPNGAYIKFPWHQNIQKDAAKKDSLVLSVGSCSRIN